MILGAEVVETIGTPKTLVVRTSAVTLSKSIWWGLLSAASDKPGWQSTSRSIAELASPKVRVVSQIADYAPGRVS
jgi:hypothetical protein